MNPWCDPMVARQQRGLVDRQLEEGGCAPFMAYATAIRKTECPGTILEVGCASGYGREVLDRAGIKYRRYRGIDISPEAIRIAREHYPESEWVEGDAFTAELGEADIVVDGCAMMHVEDWRGYLARLCSASKRWVILHRVPHSTTTQRSETQGYGQTFPAWRFMVSDVVDTMRSHGFEPCGLYRADSDAETLVFARPRHYATYCDEAYLPKLRVLQRSMNRHCAPYRLHLLWWGNGAPPSGELFTGTSASEFLATHPGYAIDALPGNRRTHVEHMWTCGPQWCIDVMRETDSVVTYVDADVMFHASPEPLFVGKPALYAPSHDFAHSPSPYPTWESHSQFGAFNVSLVHCSGGSIMTWAKWCHEWCYDRLKTVCGMLLYGDQRYLNELATEYEYRAACPGPWCVHNRALDVRDGRIHWGGMPMIAYHYSGVSVSPAGDETAVTLARPEYGITERVANIVYAPYLRELAEVMR